MTDCGLVRPRFFKKATRSAPPMAGIITSSRIRSTSFCSSHCDVPRAWVREITWNPLDDRHSVIAWSTTGSSSITRTLARLGGKLVDRGPERGWLAGEARGEGRDGTEGFLRARSWLDALRLGTRALDMGTREVPTGRRCRGAK